MTRPGRAALLALTLALGAALPAQAECYADYKAKRDDPLRLHYGVAEIAADRCTKRAAARDLAPRLERDGWTLLNILSTFGREGLAERESSAGEYFLRY